MLVISNYVYTHAIIDVTMNPACVDNNDDIIFIYTHVHIVTPDV